MIIPWQDGEKLEISRKCFCCPKRVAKNGLRRRILIEGDTKQALLLQRYRCSGCGKSYIVLPQNMLPYKRYAAKDIDTSLQHHEDTQVICDTGCEERTRYRWRQQFQPLLREALSCLLSIRRLQGLSDSFETEEKTPWKCCQQALQGLTPCFATVLEEAFWVLHQLRRDRPAAALL